ncbi:MAG: CoA-binding protein [Actinomycetia bacterium]|nr:CoA-binding protein [Actinomycetes bacterium]
MKHLGWGNRLRLVNPSGGTLHGLPLYKRVADIPGRVDLAVIIVPARAVPEVLTEVAARGIRHAIIESAGFAEVGEKGLKLQDRSRRVAQKHGIRVIGPNCVGVVNTANRFTTVEILDEALAPGPTSIIAQSGVFGTIMLDMLYQYRLHISKAVTLGNRMDVNECDALAFLKSDTNTRVIMMYLEGAADGVRLRDTLAEVTRDKPVLVLKSGRTEAGRSATASHTGSLSGENKIYDAVFAQTGTVRASTLEELVEMARVFSTQTRPPGNRLGIVTSSGSLGVMATDTAISSGLSLPSLSRHTVGRVREGAPGWMNVRNPLDVGPSGQYGEALAALLEDPGVDMVLAITVVPFVVFKEIGRQGLPGTSYFGDIASIQELAPRKPLVVCAVGNNDFVSQMREASGPEVPVFISPEPAVRALAALYRYWAWRGEV